MLVTAIGVLIVAVTVLDSLLTVLDSSGRSIFSTKVYRATWWIWRNIAKPLPRPLAQAWLSLAVPLMIAFLIALWIMGIVTGFALIFFGGLSFGDIVTGGGSQPSLSSAFRLSWVTLSTIGFVEISPSNMAYSVTVALEALLGTVILTFSITYFLSIHRSILNYDRLVADLRHRMTSKNDAIETVAAHLYIDDMHGLERWLERLHDGVVGMQQSLSRYPIVYFVRPKNAESSLPSTLQALGRVADSLSCFLPDNASASRSPALSALRNGMVDLVDDLRETHIPVFETNAPKPVSCAEFEAAVKGNEWAVEPSVRRFLEGCSAFRQITGRNIDMAGSYDRYCQWLPAATRTHRLVCAIRNDLGYQEDLRHRRSSYLRGLLNQGPKQRSQALIRSGSSS